MNYTINEIKPDGALVITFTYDAITKTETIYGIMSEDPEVLMQNISSYLAAYAAGKVLEAREAQVEVPIGIAALVGQKLEA